MQITEIIFCYGLIMASPIPYDAHPKAVINRAWFNLCPPSNFGGVKGHLTYIRSFTCADELCCSACILEFTNKNAPRIKLNRLRKKFHATPAIAQCRSFQTAVNLTCLGGKFRGRKILA